MRWSGRAAGLMLLLAPTLSEAQEAPAPLPIPAPASPASDPSAAPAPSTPTAPTAPPIAPAFGDDVPPSYQLKLRTLEMRPGSLEDFARRPFSMTAAGLGFLTLPDAHLCSQRNTSGTCRSGDWSPSLEVWQLFRINRQFMLGAGAMLALIPVTDAPRNEPTGIERDHSRSYLTFESTARWYPYVRDSFEAWGGIVAGLLVVNDQFAVVAQEQKPLIGKAGGAMRTEGFSAGIGGGFDYQIAPSWTVGGQMRLGQWLLPSHPAVSSLGDEASLVGRNTYLVLTATIAYRLRL